MGTVRDKVMGSLIIHYGIGSSALFSLKKLYRIFLPLIAFNILCFRFFYHCSGLRQNSVPFPKETCTRKSSLALLWTYHPKPDFVGVKTSFCSYSRKFSVVYAHGIHRRTGCKRTDSKSIGPCYG